MHWRGFHIIYRHSNIFYMLFIILILLLFCCFFFRPYSYTLSFSIIHAFTSIAQPSLSISYSFTLILHFYFCDRNIIPNIQKISTRPCSMLCLHFFRIECIQPQWSQCKCSLHLKYTTQIGMVWAVNVAETHTEKGHPIELQRKIY